MYYRIRPPEKFVGRALKQWYRRLCSGGLPIDWRDHPALWVRADHLQSAIYTLHLSEGYWPPCTLSLKTYRP